MATRSSRWWPPTRWYQPIIPRRIWWSWLPGVTVSLPWPSNEWSADPNEHYRPWLEENVGRQGWDWQWRPILGTTMITPGYETEDALGDRVEIKFRSHHDRHAVMAILKWA